MLVWEEELVALIWEVESVVVAECPKGKKGKRRVLDGLVDGLVEFVEFEFPAKHFCRRVERMINIRKKKCIP